VSEIPEAEGHIQSVDQISDKDSGEVLMTEHKVVMTLSEQAFAEVRKFGSVTEEEMAAGVIPEAVYITKQNWDDMGSPEAITVTIVPGDTLNQPEGEVDA